jgi:hypothetical protein
MQALIVTLRPGALTPPLNTDAVIDGKSPVYVYSTTTVSVHAYYYFSFDK